MPAKLEDVEEPLNILYYGEGGTGKTSHLAHMADAGKILVINAESGLKARALKQLGVKTANIEIYPEPGEPVTFEGLEATWKHLYEQLNKSPKAYVGCYWDSLTEIYSVLLDAARADAYQRSLRGVKPRESEFFTDRADYGVMTEQVRKLVRKYRDLPIHFGASALERREQDDDGEVTYYPSVNPALQKDLYLWFDVVCHTTLKIDEDKETKTVTEQFRGAFRPVGKYRAKDRFKATPVELIDPTFDRVLAYVEGALTLESDPVIKKARANKANKQTRKPNA
jgi:hypothetical protein